MGLQQWCFSLRGRLGRQAFWAWMGIWLLLLLVLFSLAGAGMLPLQAAAFLLVLSLWPTAAVWVKRLHDRNKSGWWALLAVLAWMLAAGNWMMLGPVWVWALGRFLPLLIYIMLILDCGVFAGTAGDNRYGPPAVAVNWRRFGG
ncbi:DUF805 domain-containing protein [Edwardsiella tarda]|uniref:DUF805 domain-containing protein n=1 Tax=Edwardsiella tarda TaxID=636 RepID=UPI00063BE311|nr:DUF805 domain-containing protein [Edwardsiella tarda]AKH87680.1 DUF805 domain-containing protein [Edwardsiella tarda]